MRLILTMALALGGACATQAQTLPLPPIPNPGQVSTPSYAFPNNPSPNWDHWGMQSLRAEEGQVRRQIARTTSGAEWNRARRAAMAINAGRCGEAAAIAAASDDARLMDGVKRACAPT